MVGFGLAFFSAAVMFLAMALWGYTTQRDLTKMGSFLIMGLIGIIIASIVNMFLQSGTFYLIISGLGVLIFSGLIAYDTQRLKATYYALGGDQRSMAVATCEDMVSRSEPSCLSSWLKMSRTRRLLTGGIRCPARRCAARAAGD